MNTRSDPIPLLKQQVADHIVAAVEGWSQSFAAYYLGTCQPRVCDLRAGRLQRFSLQKLIVMLHALDHTVAVEITCPRRSAICSCARRSDQRERDVAESYRGEH